MNNFSKGFVACFLLLVFAPALFSWNIQNVGPGLVFLHVGFLPALLYTVGIPFLVGLANNNWRIPQQG
ncbi:hypothetical protein [Gilvimarinus chinensis]|uniref:hypothetical protein n=1 Tax=Gilvimarinus chinensis TaxID=396005 RepID=UPI0012FA45B9|nr:hypothetical protein [Gilvimarinus chinensis]